MDDVSKAGSHKPSLSTRLVLGACALALLGAALAVGLDDNPLGLGLAFLATVAALLPFTLGFQSQRQYETLLVGSLAALFVFGLIAGLCESTAQTIGAPWLRTGCQVLGGALFFACILLCPAGLLVGAVGALVKWLHRPRRQPV